MHDSARLKAVSELLEVILDHTTKIPADNLFVNYCRDRRYIGSKDRQFIADYFFACLRHFDSLTNALSQKFTPRSLALLYWLFKNDSFSRLKDYSFIPKAKGNGTSFNETKSSTYGIDFPQKDEVHRLKKAVKTFEENIYLIPEWTIPHFKNLGKSWEDHVKILHDQAPFDIRINPITSDRERLLTVLSKQGIEAVPSELSPIGIRLSKRVPLQELDIWKKGYIEIQDEGAQLVSLLCDAKPEHHVLDYCAGVGGKTLLLAAEMENKGRLIATDLHPWRLEKCKQRYRRAQVFNLQIKTLEDGKWWKRHYEKFDRVLIDVPCSGSGTWRRNPDLKLRFKEKDLTELIDVQKNILETTTKYVKPGGYLIYATCSLWASENQEQIEKFIKDHHDFELMNVQESFTRLTGKEVDDGDHEKSDVYKKTLQLTPLEHHVDGFFIAILKKKDVE